MRFAIRDPLPSLAQTRLRSRRNSYCGAGSGSQYGPVRRHLYGPDSTAALSRARQAGANLGNSSGAAAVAGGRSGLSGLAKRSPELRAGGCLHSVRRSSTPPWRAAMIAAVLFGLPACWQVIRPRTQALEAGRSVTRRRLTLSALLVAGGVGPAVLVLVG